MKRVALVCSEPIRERLAGIGIRYLEMARRLPREGLHVRLLSPADPAEAPALPEEVSVRPFDPDRLSELLAGCDAVVAQGQLANDVLLRVPELPVAVDLYDPWLVENLHYTPVLGLDPYRNDHATWVLQMSRGDFFLCSSEEQRRFYLGFLAALGRLNPRRVADDPELRTLLAVVPFGIPEALPPHRPVLEGKGPGERWLLFGALYDWYDPSTLLEALGTLVALPWRLVLIRHPDPGGTPQRLWKEVEAEARRRGWWENRVLALPWQSAERRYDLLRDVDLLVSTHRPGLETELAVRTRFLDAFAVGCPVVTSDGGTVARLVRESGAGWVVPPEEPAALAQALLTALSVPEEAARRGTAGAALAERFRWERVLEPLVAFCREPRVDPTKEDFAFRPETRTPADPLSFRLRRRARRWLRRGDGR